MRKLIVAEHISLDGVIQAPGGPDEDPSSGFNLGGWSVPYGDPAIGDALTKLFEQPFELLLGRNTYDIWAPYWPNVKPGNPIGDRFNAVTKHVATHQPDTLDWHPSNALTGDIAESVRALKSTDGPDLMTWGSGDLLHQLLAAGLIDELWLLVYPVVLGSGKRLFNDQAQPSAFTVTHSSSTPAGVLINRYQQSGEPRTGSFTED